MPGSENSTVTEGDKLMFRYYAKEFSGNIL